MKIALVQDAVHAEFETNAATALAHVRQAIVDAADLVVFPECYLTGYNYHSRADTLAAAQPVTHPVFAEIAELCRSGGVHAVVGCLERDGSSVYNSAVVLGPSGLVGIHRKAHLPFMGADRFTDRPLDEPLRVFDAGKCRFGIAVCYELRFPEVCRTLALKGADIIAVPTNWADRSRILAETFSSVRAAENKVYLVTANRNDAEGEFRFMGASRIIDPNGVTLVDTGTRSGLFSATIDLGAARNKRTVFDPGVHEISIFEDRRSDLYIV